MLQLDLEKLKKIRKNKFTLAEFGARIGVSRQLSSDWENGNRPILPKYQHKIEELLGIDYSELIIGPYIKEFHSEMPEIIIKPDGSIEGDENAKPINYHTYTHPLDGMKVDQLPEKFKNLIYKNCNAKGELILPKGSDLENDNSEAKPLEHSLNEVPVLSFAQAAAYEPALEPVDDFATDQADHYESFDTPKKQGYFALRVDGDSMSPALPNDSVVYVAGGEFPQRGDWVVAKIRKTGQVIVKEYARKDNLITLSSINPNGKHFKWHTKEEPGKVEWMWPVIEYKCNRRRQRWEEHKNGFH